MPAKLPAGRAVPNDEYAMVDFVSRVRAPQVLLCDYSAFVVLQRASGAHAGADRPSLQQET